MIFFCEEETTHLPGLLPLPVSQLPFFLNSSTAPFDESFLLLKDFFALLLQYSAESERETKGFFF